MSLVERLVAFDAVFAAGSIIWQGLTRLMLDAYKQGETDQ